jgi:hypothetical protein
MLSVSRWVRGGRQGRGPSQSAIGLWGSGEQTLIVAFDRSRSFVLFLSRCTWPLDMSLGLRRVRIYHEDEQYYHLVCMVSHALLPRWLL